MIFWNSYLTHVSELTQCSRNNFNTVEGLVTSYQPSRPSPRHVAREQRITYSDSNRGQHSSREGISQSKKDHHHKVSWPTLKETFNETWHSILDEIYSNWLYFNFIMIGMKCITELEKCSAEVRVTNFIFKVLHWFAYWKGRICLFEMQNLLSQDIHLPNLGFHSKWNLDKS